MNAHSKIHQAYLDEWSIRFANQAASGLTISEWCAKNNLSIHKYNYWKHQFKESITDKVLPDIVPVMLQNTATNNSYNSYDLYDSRNSSNSMTQSATHRSISVIINDIRIEISASDISLLPDILKAVRNA